MIFFTTVLSTLNGRAGVPAPRSDARLVTAAGAATPPDLALPGSEGPDPSGQTRSLHRCVAGSVLIGWICRAVVQSTGGMRASDGRHASVHWRDAGSAATGRMAPGPAAAGAAPTGTSRSPRASRTRRCRRGRVRSRGRRSARPTGAPAADISSRPSPRSTTCEPASSGIGRNMRPEGRIVDQRRVADDRAVGQRGDRRLQVQHLGRRHRDDRVPSGSHEAAELRDARRRRSAACVRRTPCRRP